MHRLIQNYVAQTKKLQMAGYIKKWRAFAISLYLSEEEETIIIVF